ncbi:flagellin [Azospirillum melinis]|jgi:flagellin|uniref:Flagellin n=2 Tax=Azospirillum TaxID=191 RepID=A0A2B8BEC5_9PROT|nr:MULTISPECIES: flagellin [Azospirillum]MBP2305513.1 flagellin [Azospirillum melinis]MBY6265938.1 flagellin [Azospirillum sp. 412522]NUA97976.1 flagellin [Azospirillum melinis]PGH57096.1 flagellin [Azospirillum palustre]PWC47207.1 flagellin [Azospirillum sp. TSA6c]
MPVISTNTASNSALRYLNINSTNQSDSVSKIASGSRITKASDDAAGLAVGTSLKSDVTVLNQAATNASHGSSILQTADGGMSSISDIVQRMRSLATQSLSGSVTDNERSYLDAEFQQLQDEIDGIASGTRFNDESLLDGATNWSTGVSFRVGTTSNDNITVQIAGVTTTGLGINTLDVGTSATAAAALTALDTAVTTLSDARADVGALISRFEFRSDMIDTTIENTEAAQSKIMDVDVAEEQSKLASEKVLTQAAIAVLSQANQMPENLLSLLR